MSDLISFDYAIKYLLKDKGDYEIVEGFISALLGSAGYSPVKITALLESESNREVRYLKRSVADVIVADEDGNNYIIEIDRSYTSSYMHKAVFNSSRLIVDNLNSNQDYFEIKKVFHINLLYFPFTDNNAATAPLQHGKVIFHGIDTHQVNINLADRRMNIFDVRNIFPEYFLISVPLFDNVVRQELDEWLYLMKNSRIKEDFKSPYMQKVAERLNVLMMSDEDRERYDAYLMESMKGRDYLVSAEERGRAKGVEEGIEKGKIERNIEIARSLLLQNIDINVISNVTGLSLLEIKELQ